MRYLSIAIFALMATLASCPPADKCKDPAGQVIVSVDGADIASNGSYDFGHVYPLLQGPATFTVKNGGSTPLTIGEVSLGGKDAGEFTIVEKPGAAIAVQASADLKVVFKPASLNGVPAAPPVRSATLSIRADGCSEPVVVNLTGKVSYYDCLSGEHVDYNLQCNTCYLDVGPAVKEYVDLYVRPVVDAQSSLPEKLKAIRPIILQTHPLWLLGRNLGLPPAPSQHWVPELLDRLSVIATEHSIPQTNSDQVLAAALADATALDLLSGINNLAALEGLAYTMEDYVALYSFYDVTVPEYFLFCFTAEDIIKYRVATGCTSFAQAYVAIVNALNLFADPADVRYVLTARATNYNLACEFNQPCDPFVTISGHQVVLVKISGTWYVVNETVLEQDLIAMPATFDPDTFANGSPPYENIELTFPTERGPTIHVIRGISADANTSICDNASTGNISVSGRYTSNICLWNDVELPPTCGTITPEPITELNSNVNDGTPEISADGLTIYFMSSRAGGAGGPDIWYATRPRIDAPFGAPINLAEVNSAAGERGPAISADGLTIYFTSDRTGGAGGADIWFATRADTGSTFHTPLNLAEINTAGLEGAPDITSDDLALYFTSDRNGPDDDIWVATRSSVSASFGEPVEVAELNSSYSESAPSLTSDGLTIFFDSYMTGSADIFYATRAAADQPFGAVYYAAQVNTELCEGSPGISADGTVLYFNHGDCDNGDTTDIYTVDWRCP